MGECDICGKWHCECVHLFLEELHALEEHRKETLRQHAVNNAKRDQPFQQFLSSLRGDGDVSK